WIDAGSRRSAFYTNLPSGAYRFQVQACNSDGVWNRVGDQLAIAQQPHFYERAWFYGAVLLGLTVTGFVLHRWRTAVLRWENERLERGIRDRAARFPNAARPF